MDRPCCLCTYRNGNGIRRGVGMGLNIRLVGVGSVPWDLFVLEVDGAVYLAVVVAIRLGLVSSTAVGFIQNDL